MVPATYEYHGPPCPLEHHPQRVDLPSMRAFDPRWYFPPPNAKFSDLHHHQSLPLPRSLGQATVDGRCAHGLIRSKGPVVQPPPAAACWIEGLARLTNAFRLKRARSDHFVFQSSSRT
jgi:hypothetical protein